MTMSMYKTIKLLQKNLVLLSVILFLIYLVLLFILFLVSTSINSNESMQFLITVQELGIQASNFIRNVMYISICTVLLLFLIEAVTRKSNKDSIYNMMRSRYVTKSIRKTFEITVTDKEDKENKEDKVIKEYNQIIKQMHILITKEQVICEISTKMRNESLKKLKENLDDIKEELSFECKDYIFSDAARENKKYQIVGSRK